MTPVGNILTEGKTKILKPGAGPGEWIATYKDAATAFNGKKHAEIPGKGALNALISALLFKRLAAAGLPTCFIREGSAPNELVYRRLTMIPLEVVVRNAAYGSVVKRFGLSEGQTFSRPLVEFFHKSADDPLITDDLILELNLVSDAEQLAAIRRMALASNEVFLSLFAACGIRCADFKLEFGLDESGNLTLGDELSPDNFRLRDAETGAVLDKDVFRLDLADLADTYRTLLRRLEQAPDAIGGKTRLYPVEIAVESRKTILNPESRTILDTLHALGYADVTQLRAGKRFTLELRADSLPEAERLAHRLASEILSNPVIEDYTLNVVGSGHSTEDNRS